MGIIANRFAAVCIGGCAVGIAGCGAMLNYNGAKVMAPGEAADILALAAVLSEGVKLSWLSGFRVLVCRRELGAALAVCLCGVLLHTYSVIAVLGSSAAGRDKVASEREGKQNALASAQAAVAAAKTDVERMAGIRSEAQVQQDIDVKLEAPDTNGCKAPKGKEAKQTCNEVQTLRAELIQARKADEARHTLREAQGRLDGRVQDTPRSVDPQAEAIAAYIPVSAETIGKALPLLPSALVEFTPMIAMLLATILWGGEAEPKRNAGAKEDREAPAGEAGPERQALDRITALVLNSPDGRLVASQRRLAELVGAPKSTFADWVSKWVQSGEIETASEGNKTAFLLPKKAA